MHICPKCLINKKLIEFYKNKANKKTGLQPYCINLYAAKRRASKLQRTPNWLSSLQLEHIKLFYEAAAQMTKETNIQFDVDHIVPLQGEIVSGLHVPWNLQVITNEDNCRKGNKFNGF